MSARDVAREVHDVYWAEIDRLLKEQLELLKMLDQLTPRELSNGVVEAPSKDKLSELHKEADELLRRHKYR